VHLLKRQRALCTPAHLPNTRHVRFQIIFVVSSMVVPLMPNWVVKFIRSPNLRTKHWLSRPVEVFHVSPKMTKFDIKEYLVKLYNLPVSHVHTAIYEGKSRVHRPTGVRFREPDYKKAYVYMHDELGAQKPRYHLIEFQTTPEAREAWPAMPHRAVGPIPKRAERGPMPPRTRVAARQKPLNWRRSKPHDPPFPADVLE
jgi:large subunit ribosomal protein L23